MNRLRIKHSTGFHYGGDVTASYNEARMLPVSADGQLVLYSHVEILPISSQHNYVDYWGSRVSSFEILTPHKELSLTATSLVEVRPRVHTSEKLSWDALTALAETATSYIEQTKQTRRTDPPDDVIAIAREIAGRSVSPCDAALEICTVIGDAVEYMQGVTGVTSTAKEAWAVRKGVCQDITHLALGALRSVGIPARYVSGYLHPSRMPRSARPSPVNRTRGSSGSAESGAASTRRTSSTSATGTSPSAAAATTTMCPRCAVCTRARTAAPCS